jgi:hypothetical protein
MSHIVQIKTELKDETAIAAACRRLKLESLGKGKHTLFSGQTAEGIAVNLPGWQYPVVINTDTGAAAYDNYNGHWGEQKELDKFIQAYTVEKAVYEAQKGGYSTYEEVMPDGSIKVTINMGE